MILDTTSAPKSDPKSASCWRRFSARWAARHCNSPEDLSVNPSARYLKPALTDKGRQWLAQQRGK